MSLSLAGTSKALSPGLQASFLASGGSTPYVYTVSPGGVGGSIDASSGIYVAPLPAPGSIVLNGADTIVVTDAVNNTASLQVVVGNALILLCDIIQTQLGLSPGQVYVWDQKIDIPTDSRIYISVASLTQKPFGNSNSFLDGDQVQSVNMMSSVQIDIFSRSTDARDRKEEIILALNSIYAQQQMAMNSFSVGQLSSQFVNLSETDGAAILYRYSITVNLQYFVTKTLVAPYFSTISVSVPQIEP